MITREQLDAGQADVSDIATGESLPPIHPGEHLKDILDELHISQYQLAKDVGMSKARINQIIHGKRSITAEPALRLGRYFGTSAQFWLNLQNQYDMATALLALGNRLETEVKPRAA